MEKDMETNITLRPSGGLPFRIVDIIPSNGESTGKDGA